MQELQTNLLEDPPKKRYIVIGALPITVDGERHLPGDTFSAWFDEAEEWKLLYYGHLAKVVEASSLEEEKEVADDTAGSLG